MKIEKPSSKPLPSAPIGEASTRSPSSKAGSATTSNPNTSTSVHLGATSAQLRSMESSMSNTPVVDVAKVAEIRQAISEGRFQINSGVVADRLIATARELLGAGAH